MTTDPSKVVEWMMETKKEPIANPTDNLEPITEEEEKTLELYVRSPSFKENFPVFQPLVSRLLKGYMGLKEENILLSKREKKLIEVSDVIERVLIQNQEDFEKEYKRLDAKLAEREMEIKGLEIINKRQFEKINEYQSFRKSPVLILDQKDRVIEKMKEALDFYANEGCTDHPDICLQCRDAGWKASQYLEDVKGDER
jgi:hypothetical protein